MTNPQDDPSPFAMEPNVKAHAHAMEYSSARQRLALQMLRQARDNLSHVIELLEQGDTPRATRHMVEAVAKKQQFQVELESGMGRRTIEGVFDGRAMVGEDGIRYDVPENYASKSKLVEGDMLKLTIRPDDGYVFKQISPVPRKRLVGILHVDPSTQEPIVMCGSDVYKVLAASVSYYKGISGDELVILVPSGGKSAWAAVERLHS